MADIDEITNEILRHEGGFVNDPDDPGGPTNFGVTLKTLKRLGYDLDGDGGVDIDDLRGLSRNRAAEIFKTHYFHAPKIASLPAPLHAPVFDMYVNSGRAAVRLLQQVLTRFGIRVAVDGVIGPQTIAAARKALALAPDHLVDAYGIARRNFYYALADRRVSARKYARRRDGGKGGWIRRAETFISPQWHLSAADHARRVAAWG